MNPLHIEKREASDKTARFTWAQRAGAGSPRGCLVGAVAGNRSPATVRADKTLLLTVARIYEMAAWLMPKCPEEANEMAL